MCRKISHMKIGGKSRVNFELFVTREALNFQCHLRRTETIFIDFLMKTWNLNRVSSLGIGKHFIDFCTLVPLKTFRFSRRYKIMCINWFIGVDIEDDGSVLEHKNHVTGITEWTLYLLIRTESPLTLNHKFKINLNVIKEFLWHSSGSEGGR